MLFTSEIGLLNLSQIYANMNNNINTTLKNIGFTCFSPLFEKYPAKNANIVNAIRHK